MINGQESVNKFFSGKSLYDLPRSFIVCGEFGCGKNLLVDSLSNMYGVKKKSIEEYLNGDLLDILLDVKLGLKVVQKILYLLKIQKLMKNYFILIPFIIVNLKIKEQFQL